MVDSHSFTIWITVFLWVVTPHLVCGRDVTSCSGRSTPVRIALIGWWWPPAVLLRKRIQSEPSADSSPSTVELGSVLCCCAEPPPTSCPLVETRNVFLIFHFYSRVSEIQLEDVSLSSGDWQAEAGEIKDTVDMRASAWCVLMCVSATCHVAVY